MAPGHEPQVCIDCSPLIVRSAGVKTFLYHWVSSLESAFPDRVSHFPLKHLGQLDHRRGMAGHPLSVLRFSAARYLPRIGVDTAIPKCDVFHISTLLRTIPRRPMLSATIYDMTSWIMPQHHPSARVTSDIEFGENVLKKAQGLIAISENTRRDAVRILGLNPERIAVVMPGIPREYFDVPAAAAEAAIAFYGLGKPYLLWIGTIEPRKNLDLLLDSWLLLPPWLREETDLVLAGMPGWNCSETLARIRYLSTTGSGIRYLDYVPESYLPGLTAGALALVFPSLYEGFGIPVAQAMAAGCAVITSNVSSLAELTAGAALLIDPQSSSELTSAMKTLVESSTRRRHLASLGRERAESLTLPAAARVSMHFFESLFR